MFRFLYIIIVSTIFQSCRPPILEKCKELDPGACCFLKRTEAESPLGSPALEGEEADFDWYSTCTFNAKATYLNQAIKLTWFRANKNPKVNEILEKLTTDTLEGCTHVPNLDAKASWCPQTILFGSEVPALFVAKKDNLFLVSAAQMEGQVPWMMEREVARWVLRRESMVNNSRKEN